jgi:hypothetical protein
MDSREWWERYVFIQYKANKGEITRLEARKLEFCLVDFYVGKIKDEEIEELFTEEYLVWRTKRRLLGER